MKKFEYKVLKVSMSGFLAKSVPGDIEETLNEQGLQGWQLVTTIAPTVIGGESQSVVMTFMREFPD